MHFHDFHKMTEYHTASAQTNCWTTSYSVWVLPEPGEAEVKDMVESRKVEPPAEDGWLWVFFEPQELANRDHSFRMPSTRCFDP